MKASSNLETSAIYAGIFGLVSFFGLRTFIRQSCPAFYGNYNTDFNTSYTSAVIAIIAGVTFFAIMMLINTKVARGGLEKFDKILILLIVTWFSIWVALVLIDNDYCSASGWRKRGALLLLPSALAGLSIFGRHWLNSDD